MAANDDLLTNSPIGVFDSGYGGLTVLRNLVDFLPTYDFLYMGDNARAPYGTRSFETVYKYVLEAVEWFFAQGCPLLILACNTASAKALRTIQQKDLPFMADPSRRVLGVIRPTAEIIGRFSKTKKVGVLGTKGTVNSLSYPIEISHFWPEFVVSQEACPMWVPLVENNETEGEGARYFVQKNLHSLLAKDADIDAILLACTHYPLLQKTIIDCLPTGITLLGQGQIVANSLKDYLQRHPQMDQRLSKQSLRRFYTTDNANDFDQHAALFYGEAVRSERVELGDR